MGDLREYRAKRDPARTPEPVPVPDAAARTQTRTSKRHGEPIFVLHEHRARSLHWDLRLEHDGVLACWALPKGVPAHSSADRTAIHTENHPLEYASFQGVIPQGEYGAGTMAVFDHGTYAPLKWTDHEVKIELFGQRVVGRFALFRTGEQEDAWRMHLEKGQDPPGWEPVPTDLEPMLATVGASPPRSRGWAAEFKWDGWRVLARVEGGRVRLRTRNGLDVTDTFPEIKALGRQAGSTTMLLDGEVVATRDGKISFAALQSRIGAEGAKAVRLAAKNPVTYMVFDVLHLDGRSLLELPYGGRRKLLEALELSGPAWQTPPSFLDESVDVVLAAAVAQDLEGVVVKRVDSTYQTGARSPDWRKVKRTNSQSVVIGGFTPERIAGSTAAESQRSRPMSEPTTASKPKPPKTIGALLVGVTEDDGTLTYAGRVGSGLAEDVRRDLLHALTAITRPDSPFASAVPKSDAGPAVWTEPLLVAEVSFAEWTRTGRLRHPVFKGLRPDKGPEQATREDQR